MNTVYSNHHRLHAPYTLLMQGSPSISREIPARAEVIRAAVEQAAPGTLVPPTDHGLSPILHVHKADFVTYLQHAYAWNAAARGKSEPVLVDRLCVTAQRPANRPRDLPALQAYYTFDYEDPILEHTWEAAYWSAQCALTAADLALRGEPSVYALCRPPGHHATADQYGGFCYLNNVAIAARYVQNAAGSVAILDLDYHHGNGTQAIFYDDPAVLFCSLHADPDQDYPFFWGRATERGNGEGLGYNVNWPLPLGTDDAHYLEVLDRALAVIVDFAPRYLLISLGLDIMAGDPIGKFNITPAGLREVAQRVADLHLPTIIVQEGGYRLSTLGRNVVTFLQAFSKP